MGNEFPNQPGGAHLRTIAMPRDANASGDIFGGWTLSQMDLAGGTFAANHSGKRVVTVRIEAVEFLTPVYIGDDVIPMPESSDLSLMTDRVGKGWFSMLCHGSELIGSGMRLPTKK